MVFTLIGWYQSLDAAALALIDALADQHVRVEGKNVIVPGWAPNIMGCYAYGTDITLAQLASPSLRTLANLDIRAVDKAAEPTSNPPLHDLFERSIPLEPSEALTFLAAEDNAAAGVMAGLAWLGDAIAPAPAGKMFMVAAAATVAALTANVWSNRSFSFSQTLPAGRYACVGARAETAGLKAFRFCPVGVYHRPGAIGFDALGDIEPARFRCGRAGVWFEFEHDQPPTIDLLSISADTALSLWMDLIQIRAGRA